jgi:hypothetical protein
MDLAVGIVDPAFGNADLASDLDDFSLGPHNDQA